MVSHPDHATATVDVVHAPVLKGLALGRSLEVPEELAGALGDHLVDGEPTVDDPVMQDAAFLPYRNGVAVLAAVRKLWPDQFAWRTDTYEFRSDVPAIDLLTGRTSVREAIDRGDDFDSIMTMALAGTETYDAGRDAALLY